MLVKDIVDEDFANYKKPSMFIGAAMCDWKCCSDAGVNNSMCQNFDMVQQKDVEISVNEIFRRYTSNLITRAIVFGGLEPMLQFDEMFAVIKWVRNQGCDDDVVIYTGYYPSELLTELEQLEQYKNIIIKFGRFVPDGSDRYDEVLGVVLISSNQYGEKIS